jgi:hypothetical protein
MGVASTPLPARRCQGDRVRLMFVISAIVYFGHFLKIHKDLFSQKKMLRINVAKIWAAGLHFWRFFH